MDPETDYSKTHCKNGHEFTANNTRIQPNKRFPHRADLRICKACTSVRARQHYERLTPEDKILRAEKARARKFGLTLEELRELVGRSACDICSKKKGVGRETLYIDHCHTTGKVRGLLCHSCNTSLGHFRDNTELLMKAINYLKAI